jgi:putative sterol carrier protein
VDDVVRAFFEGIGGTNPDIPKTISGSIRFDLDNDRKPEHWRVTFDKGSISSSSSDAPADCAVRTDKKTFEQVIRGQMNAMAALLRGAMHAEGDLLLLAVFRNVLAAPAAASTAPKARSTVGRPS